VIGWSVANHMRTDIVADALSMAVASRGGNVEGVIFHQYTSAQFADLCTLNGVRHSMGATGVCWANAVAEAVFSTLKRELYYKQAWPTRADARRAIIRWIEGWFNPKRMHATNNYLSPIQAEDAWYRHNRKAA
jgi:putative transposase